MTAAQCYCGQVRLQFSAPPKSVIHCHCGECRRLSGAAFTTWVSFAMDAMSLADDAAVTAFEATPNVCRHFCSRCGSHVYSLDGRAPQIVGVPAGAVEGELPAPKAHYFVHHKAGWHAIGDGLPQFGGETGFEAL